MKNKKIIKALILIAVMLIGFLSEVMVVWAGDPVFMGGVMIAPSSPDKNPCPPNKKPCPPKHKPMNRIPGFPKLSKEEMRGLENRLFLNRPPRNLHDYSGVVQGGIDAARVASAGLEQTLGTFWWHYGNFASLGGYLGDNPFEYYNPDYTLKLYQNKRGGDWIGTGTKDVLDATAAGSLVLATGIGASKALGPVLAPILAHPIAKKIGSRLALQGWGTLLGIKRMTERLVGVIKKVILYFRCEEYCNPTPPELIEHIPDLVEGIPRALPTMEQVEDIVTKGPPTRPDIEAYTKDKYSNIKKKAENLIDSTAWKIRGLVPVPIEPRTPPTRSPQPKQR